MEVCDTADVKYDLYVTLQKWWHPISIAAFDAGCLRNCEVALKEMVSTLNKERA